MGVTTILEREKRIRVHALSGFNDFPQFVEGPLPRPELLTEPWEFHIIDDMPADPRYAQSPTLKAGMRSVLGLPVRFAGRLRYGVNFYARTTGAFWRETCWSPARIADHVAVAGRDAERGPDHRRASPRHGADDDRAGAAGGAFQQVEDGGGTRPHARAVVRAHAALRFGVASTGCRFSAQTGAGHIRPAV